MKTFIHYLLYPLALLGVMPCIVYAQVNETYSVYKLEKKIGTEVCQVQGKLGEDLAYDVHVNTNDRGYALKLDAAISARDGKIVYRSVGNTSRFKLEKIDTVLKLDQMAPVSDNGSIAIKQMLILGWTMANRPVQMETALTHRPVSIKILGTDSSIISNQLLTVYQIKGISSKPELLWMDKQFNAIFLVTCDTEGDRREVLNDKYQSFFLQFNQKSNTYLVDAYRQEYNSLGKTYNKLAITGGSLIDVHTGAIMPNALLLIENGKIVYTGKAEGQSIPANAQVIDAKGKFISPGLWNMHVHLFHPDNLRTELLSGVTTVRDMANEFDLINLLKSKTAEAGFLAPHILSAGVLDGKSDQTLGTMLATSDDEIKANVKKYHDAGFQQIKVYSSVKPKYVQNIVQEARKYNMDVVGHLPVGITAKHFIEQGVKSISHIHYFMNAVKFGKQGTLEDNNQDLIAMLKRNGVYIDPTLNVYSLIGDTKLNTYKNLLRMFYKGGIPVVAGTDNEGTVADELQLYVQAGLTPLQALQTATIVPAKVMRMDVQSGSLQAGKQADILILNSNPLQNISNLKAIHTVIKGTLVVKSNRNDTLE
ncbi:amidohydrolase family protein [Mucilaginibacter lacusdianchii]|uniref:amidohydrolase family protein n=1 Tax=Mucilaginibacter lacusdianchii TaxID=2684211 RepID=UPI00131D42E2|nr:amidohydrolase family protein [Mucilaginibacter sp. JXJ CY 39]